jgi:single-strand DNA-binding protein
MAKGVNRVTLLGNVGKDPEVRATQSGTVVASFSLATADRVKVNGNWQDSTEWHNLVAFGRTAEIVRDYIHKGSQLYVEGKIQTRSWDDRESGQRKYRTEIIVNELSMLGGGKREANAQQRSDTSGYAVEETSGYGQAYVANDEDVPF